LSYAGIMPSTIASKSVANKSGHYVESDTSNRSSILLFDTYSLPCASKYGTPPQIAASLL
ncbi:hypothetical protein ACSYAD_32170, partial [Acaryochloris marina NIES-2412]|uniref:hypothetical protein n=1 Tax=Acaryochloris marina TaxID=155978 RepID=UPI00405910C9